MRRHPPPPYETPPSHSIAGVGVMHDYKYGTLSGGSALSQSMRYAEPWLYGSMSVRTPGTRPSILAYPEPTVILGTPLITCACKDFLSGTTREKKKSSGSVCKKCGGSRKASWNVNSPSRIRGFGTVRLSQPKSRPELPALEELKDPYDIMRKSRLAAVSSTLRVPSGGKSRAKSTSPSDRRRNRSKSPPPRHRSPDRRVVDMKSLNLNNLVDVNDSSSRKSILECDVNPYELITQYLKHGEPRDSRFSIEEDELSDNLSENALDESPLANRGRSKSHDVEDSSKLRKLATASSRTKRSFLDALKTKRGDIQRTEPLQPLPGGVSIGGQRIRLFNSNDPLPIVTCANEFVSDSEENEEEVEEEIYDLEKHKAWFSDRKISEDSSKDFKVPKVASSPKRPPRKLKSGSEHVNSKKEVVQNTSDSGSKNRVNFSLDVPTQSSRRSNSLTSAVSIEIKSILKKPNSTANLSGNVRQPRALTSFSSTSSKEETKPTLKPKTPTKAKISPTPNRNSSHQTQQNRKKKQVQFIVSEGAYSGNTSDLIKSGQGEATTSEVSSVEASDDLEDVRRFQFFGDNQEDAQAVNQVPQSSNGVVEADDDSSEDQDGRRSVNSLQRSLSDCMSPGAEPGSKFNDTMRLRLRTGRRDSRDVFSQDGRKERRVLSPGRPRPKEPPPPPPPPAFDSGPTHPKSTNQFSNTETSLHQSLNEKQSSGTAISEGNVAPPPPPPPPRQIFPFTKEEIEHINQYREKKTIIRPRSSSNSPVRENTSATNTSRRTSVTLPILESEGALWLKEESVVKDDLMPFLTLDENVPAMETFSSVTEVYEALEKNSKETEESDPEINNEMDREQSVKLVIPSASLSNLSDKDIEFDQTCTVVTVSSPLQNIPVTKQKTFPNRKTSIMITGKEVNEVEQKVNKTSVLIGDFKSSDSSDCNKVTINVGGYNNQNDNSKTDKNNFQNEMKNSYKSNIIIGPSDNKSCTLLVVEPSTIPNNLEISVTKDNNSTLENGKRTRINAIHREAEEEMNRLIRNNVDPVEAARKNIVPHICGLGKLISGELKEKHVTQDTIEKLDYIEGEGSTENNMKNNEREVIFNTLSSIESEENLDDDVFASKEDTDENSDCYVCAKKLNKTGQNKDDDEEIKGLEFDSDENHYEVIRDPIYEEISDTPPPLPLSPPPTSAEINDSIPTRSIFEGASKYDILNYLETAKERVIVAEPEDELEVKSPIHSRISSLDLSSRISQLSNASDSSEDSCNLIIPATDNTSITSDKVRKSSVEIERNDSGVGSESSKCSRSRWQHLTMSQQHICEDCDQPVETQVTDSGLMFAPLVCRKCAKRRSERREIITEIVETEEKYGRDLKIMLDEFYRPMLVAGLLTPEQLLAIFLNVEELLENNAALAEKLRDALEIAIDQGDEDLLTVNIGSIFLDAVPMLHAFESYCTRQGTASLLLANLEKEKELLRIFLRVSQMENSVLRRMNLNSFLMVPVQRVTKYPLLLARLYRVTPAHLKSRETLRLAQSKIELHLEHINSLAKDISTTKLWRRISIINGRRSNSETDMINIKLRKVAVSVLEWNHDEVRFAIEGKLLFTQPTDNNWRRGRTIKLSPVNAMLVTLGKPTVDYQPESDELLAFPRKNGIRDATLLLLKEKSGRYGLLREPLFLDRCIICCEADIEDYFEVQELATKDTYLFKAEDGEQTKRWFRQLQYHAQGLGAWRKRRNALANIMINGMQLRT